jgi:hypothetical protein
MPVLSGPAPDASQQHLDQATVLAGRLGHHHPGMNIDPLLVGLLTADDVDVERTLAQGEALNSETVVDYTIEQLHSISNEGDLNC